jgi:hypothetical protein
VEWLLGGDKRGDGAHWRWLGARMCPFNPQVVGSSPVVVTNRVDTIHVTAELKSMS